MSKLYNCKLILNPEKLSTALWISEKQAINEFRDGRVVSRFSEYWASKLYDFVKCENSNEEGYDGFIVNRLLGKIKIGVRSLTNSGIKFQKSSYIGSGRKCDDEKLMESIKTVDFEIVIDITNSPIIGLIPVKADTLKELVKSNLLGCSGLTVDKFYRLAIGLKSMNDIDFDDVVQL